LLEQVDFVGKHKILLIPVSTPTDNYVTIWLTIPFNILIINYVIAILNLHWKVELWLAHNYPIVKVSVQKVFEVLAELIKHLFNKLELIRPEYLEHLVLFDFLIDFRDFLNHICKSLFILFDEIFHDNYFGVNNA